ncbi:MAG: C25 family cysteine peptidase [Planctomycetota bacterium]
MKRILLALSLSTAVFADPVEATFDRAGVAAIPLKDIPFGHQGHETMLATQDGEELPWSIEGDLVILPVPHAGVVRLVPEGGGLYGGTILSHQDSPRTRVPRSVERLEKNLVFDRLESVTMRLMDGGGDGWFWMPVTDGAKLEIPWSEWRKTVTVRVRFQPMRTPKVPHAVELWWNGHKLADANWEGGAAHTAEFRVEAVSGGKPQTLEFRTKDGPSPRVIASGPMGEGPLYLDWIEIDGPRVIDSAQASWIGELTQAAYLRDLKGVRLEYVFSMLLKKRLKDQGDALAVDGPVFAAAKGALIRPKAVTCVTAARDPEKGVEWIVIAPAAFRESLAPLVNRRREQGLSAEFVSVEEAIAAGGGDLPAHDAIARFIRHAATAWPEPKLKFVLLAGDAERGSHTGIPAGARDALGAGWTATDGWYARVDDDELPDLAVGRWPARTAEEAGALLAKVKRFEDSAPGEWRRNVHLVLGTAGFGDGMDNMLKSGGMKIAGDLVPDSYAFRVQSTLELDLPFTYPPRDYNAFLTQRVNDGCMVFAYSGHGWEHGLQSLKWDGKRYPILDVGLAKNFDSKNGLPMAFLFACLTGSFDEKEDCLCEALVRNPGGPVAAIGSSAISHPYADIIFAKELMTVMFAKRAPTIGQGVLAAKRRCLKPAEGDAMRLFIDGMAAGAVGGLDAQERYRLDGSLAYNLFGDPATRIPWPGKMKVECAKESKPGVVLEVEGSCELGDGTAIVTLEAARLKSIEPVEKIDAKAEGAEEAMKRNWKRMNEAVALRVEVEMKGGNFKTEVKVPAEIPEGDYLVKVYAGDGKEDAIGCRRVKVEKR